MKIYNAALTRSEVVQDGHAVRLDLVDDKGTEVSLELSFERAQAIAKTLPSLLTSGVADFDRQCELTFRFNARPLDRRAVQRRD